MHVGYFYTDRGAGEMLAHLHRHTFLPALLTLTVYRAALCSSPTRRRLNMIVETHLLRVQAPFFGRQLFCTSTQNDDNNYT